PQSVVAFESEWRVEKKRVEPTRFAEVQGRRVLGQIEAAGLDRMVAPQIADSRSRPPRQIRMQVAKALRPSHILRQRKRSRVEGGRAVVGEGDVAQPLTPQAL